jgi:hypothetical protein
MSLFADAYCDADRVPGQNLIKPIEKARVRDRCNGDNHGVVDCHSEDLAVFIRDAGGLELSSKPLPSSSIEIPRELVVIPPECFDWDPSEFPEIVGINLKDILSVKPKLRWGHYQLSNDVAISLSAIERPAFKDKKIVLFSSGIDVVIEKLWWERHDISLFEEIAKGNFYAVTGMNFSMFLHECPIGQWINLNKSLLYTYELSRLGVTVIPHIYAVNDHQRERVIDYLVANQVNAVTINTQLRSKETTKTALAILENTGCHLVLNGSALDLPPSYSKRVTVANQKGLKNSAIVREARKKIIMQNLPTENAGSIKEQDWSGKLLTLKPAGSPYIQQVTAGTS